MPNCWCWDNVEGLWETFKNTPFKTRSNNGVKGYITNVRGFELWDNTVVVIGPDYEQFLEEIGTDQDLEEFKKKQEEKTKKVFTKSQLKTGMKVTYRDGDVRTVSLNTEEGDKLSNEKGTFKADLDKYTEDLLHPTLRGMGIMRVVSYDGAVLWERKEKTSEELKLEEIQETIKKLQSQADQLQQTIKQNK